MQATEPCTYVLSIDDYGQVRSVGVNEGGLHMDIHIGFRPFPEHGSTARTSGCAPSAMRNLRPPKPPRSRSGVIPILARYRLTSTFQSHKVCTMIGVIAP